MTPEEIKKYIDEQVEIKVKEALKDKLSVHISKGYESSYDDYEQYRAAVYYEDELISVTWGC